MGRIEEKIMSILNEDVPYEIVGGPTPSAVQKDALDYTKPVSRATVPQATKIPGVGEIGDDDAEDNDSIDEVVDGLDEDEDKDSDDDDDDKDDKDKDLEETFASLLKRLAEDEDEDEKDDDDDKDDDDPKDDVKEDEESLKSDNGGEPEETLPDVDSKLDNPDELVTHAPGVQVAEDEDYDIYEDEESLKDDNGGTPKEVLPGKEIDAQDVDGPKGSGKKSDDDDDDKKSDDMSEDIQAIFSGTKLSESAKAKAATIFKAAVTRRVNEQKVRVAKIAARKLAEAFNVVRAHSEQKAKLYEGKLTGRVDRYLNYVVENWMTENRLAVERGIRAELAEQFISGLKKLFVEHYIEVPESKVDVVATLGKKVSKLESKLNEALESNIKMRGSLGQYRKEQAVRVVSAGLTDTQRDKLAKLSEGVEYTTQKEFAQKVLALKESYFTKLAAPKKEEPLMEAATKPLSNEMEEYSRILDKSKNK